jgi:ribonuclease G
MVVIDVNSGRYAKSKEQELNSLRTDLEASREIARQLRLRDIGGIIVIDFIDLEDDRNRKKVYDELKKEFRKDRAKVSILPMSDFGLIQITRQRIRQNIMQAMKEVCPYCLKERSFLIKCHSIIADKLKEGFPKTITKLRFKYFITLKAQADDTMLPDKFKFISKKTGKEFIFELS